MKKIFIALRDFNTGGVQQSLINLLQNFKSEIENHEIQFDILVLKKGGPLLEQAEKLANIIEANQRFSFFGIENNEAKKMGLLYYLKRSALAVISKIFGNKQIISRALKKEVPRGEYDVAISYSVSISNKMMYAGWSEIVLEKISAKEKWVYVHNDFVNSSLNNNYCLGLLSRFDKILFVTKSCEESFNESFSEFRDKTDNLYNFIDTKSVFELAEENACLSKNKGINIISVSRLSSEKGHLRVLRVLKRLKEEGLSFKWHVLGNGPMEQQIRDEIRKSDLEAYVELYGNQTNPYKFIKETDLLLQASFHESFGLVLINAFMLGVPVVTTNTISAKEVVGERGFICENNEESLYNMLKRVIIEKAVVDDKKAQLKNYKYENDNIKIKFKQLIGM